MATQTLPLADAPLTPAQWSRLASMRVFFGHQSVGRNIVTGIDDVLRGERRSTLTVVDAPNLSAVAGAAFVHHDIGRNGDPRSKTAAFAAALDAGGADDGRTVAIHKYCFVDVDSATDVDRLFADYRRAIAELHARHPDVVLVHVTMPLTSVGRPSWIKTLVRRAIGRPEYPEFALNVKRNRFNDALRREYAGREPLFDLAAIESTRADGSRVFFLRGADTVYALAPEYTDDGGHLDVAARQHVARELLRFLAGL